VSADSAPVAALRHGAMTIFLGQVLARVIPAFGKPGLIVKQIYNAGARSLVIIMLSGLFVGMVLGLLGFDTLQRFGSEDSLGVLAALGMLKVLGPVLTALLFAGRAGTSLTSEIGLMKSTDQLTAMQMMAVDPLRYVVAPRFLGGIIAMPCWLPRSASSAVRRAAHRRTADGRRRGRVLVADAERRRSARRRRRHREKPGVRGRLQPHRGL
jgi:ABC transport permease subunit